MSKLWPLLLVLILASGVAKKRPTEPPEEEAFPDVYPFGGTFDVAVLDKYQGSAQFGFTARERLALETLMKALNAGSFQAPASWDVFAPTQVAAVAGVPLDEYGALAMMAYWLATKSKERRPWPSQDLEVLAAPAVEDTFDPMGTTVSLAEYLVRRITRYKALLREAGAPYKGETVFEP